MVVGKLDIKSLSSENLIKLDMVSKQKEDAIKELTSLLKMENQIKNESKFLKAVLKREKEGTTGIGMGVAIPHGKSKTVQQPTLVFGKSKGGIEYDSLDGNPVYLMFLIAVPENSSDEHLKILSHISRKLMREEIRNQLMNLEQKSEFYTIFGG